MKKTAIALITFASLGLSGCYTTASPEGVVRSAYKALMKNDVKKFPKFLTGEAKTAYGSLKGMGELQDRLAEFAKVDIADVDLVETETNAAGKDIRREYTVLVMGAKVEGTAFESILTAHVSCDVRYVYEHVSHGPYHSAPYHPVPHHPGHGYYGPYHPGHYHGPVGYYREQEYCLISKVD